MLEASADPATIRLSLFRKQQVVVILGREAERNDHLGRRKGLEQWYFVILAIVQADAEIDLSMLAGSTSAFLRARAKRRRTPGVDRSMRNPGRPITLRGPMLAGIDRPVRPSSTQCDAMNSEIETVEAGDWASTIQPPRCRVPSIRVSRRAASARTGDR